MLLRSVSSNAHMRSLLHAACPSVAAYAVFPCGSHPMVRTHAGCAGTLLFPCACGPSPATRTFFPQQTSSFAASLFSPGLAHTARAYSTADSSIRAGAAAAAGVDWSSVDLLRVLAHLSAPGSPLGPTSPAVNTEGDVATFIEWATELPEMECDERLEDTAELTSPFVNWSDAMLVGHAEALVRAQFAPCAIPEDIEKRLTSRQRRKDPRAFWDRTLQLVYRLLPYRGVLPPRTLASIVEKGSGEWKKICGLTEEWCDRVLVVADKDDVLNGMRQRQVLVPKACAVRDLVLEQVGVDYNLIVVTGESGAGKTFSTVHRAAMRSHVLYFPQCDVVIAAKGASETDEAFRLRRNRTMSEYIVKLVRRVTGGDNLPRDNKASAVIILDEMGGKVDALRAICRLFAFEDVDSRAVAPAAATSPTKPLLILRLEAILGCTVRVVAVGTGCDTEYTAAGSGRVNPTLCRLLPAFGEQVWRGLATAAADKKPTGSDWPADLVEERRRMVKEVCCAVAPALVPEEWKHPKRLTPAPWGRVGTALVRNPRVAALILQSIEHQLKHPTPGPSFLLTNDAWETHADGMASVAIRTAVAQFAQLNGLHRLAPPDRFGFVAAAAALHMNATDADFPLKLFYELCVKAGVTTLHTIRCPEKEIHLPHARTVNSDLHPHLCVDQEAALGLGALRLRYRVTPAHVTLMTLGFGFTPRPPNEGLEAALLDYCVVAAAAADVLWAWAAGRDENLRLLATQRAPPQDVARNELFEAIRATMLFGASQGAGGAVPVPRPYPLEAASVERGRSIVPFQPTVTDAKFSIADLYQAPPQAPGAEAPHTCLFNASAASGPDLVVLLRGAGSVLIQAKDAQTYTFDRLYEGDAYSYRVVARQVVETLNELVKMGAPAFDRQSVLQCCSDLNKALQDCIQTELSNGNKNAFRSLPCREGAACLGAGSWCTFAHSPNERRRAAPEALCLHQTLAARAWKLVQSDDFPYTTFVVVRAFARASPNGRVSSPALGIVNAILTHYHASKPIKKQAARFKCVYVETYHGDPLFDPVDVAARDDRAHRARFTLGVKSFLNTTS